MKITKVFAGMAAAALAATTLALSASAAELEMTGTSVTMNDSGIRVNVYNPWGGDDTHAVPSMEGLDGATQIDIKVKVTGVDAVGSFNMVVVGATNDDAGTLAYWKEGDAANTGNCGSVPVEVTADGEYTVSL